MEIQYASMHADIIIENRKSGKSKSVFLPTFFLV